MQAERAHASVQAAVETERAERALLKKANQALTKDRDTLRRRVELAEIQLNEQGRTPMLPAEEVVRLVGDLLNGLQSKMPGLALRDGSLSLRVGFGGAGEAGGFLIPTPESDPNMKDVTHEVTLRFNRTGEPD